MKANTIWLVSRTYLSIVAVVGAIVAAAVGVLTYLDPHHSHKSLSGLTPIIAFAIAGALLVTHLVWGHKHHDAQDKARHEREMASEARRTAQAEAVRIEPQVVAQVGRWQLRRLP